MKNQRAELVALIDNYVGNGKKVFEGIDAVIRPLIKNMIHMTCKSINFNASGKKIEDITQEVVIKFWLSLQNGKYDIMSKNPEAFAQTMAKNYLIDCIRSKEKNVFSESSFENPMDEDNSHFWDFIHKDILQNTDDIDDSDYFSSSEDLEEFKVHLNDALSRLALDERIMLTLFYFEEWQYEEIAEYFDAPLGTIKGSMHKAKRNLEYILAPMYKKYIKNESQYY